MVHRPADSRLLVNLLSHEKDYSKQLATLLEYSQASLASFSAYAAASAPPASQIIITVAGTLQAADEALRNYALAVEEWQQQLRALRDMEEDVGNVTRDREILVTRLIKTSKNQKSTRDSIRAVASSSTSTLSFSKPEVHVGSKMSAAQIELQACEAQLAMKERELDVFRVRSIRTGLQMRCKAMVECGWAWGEMGKEGLRALEQFSQQIGNGHVPLPPIPESDQKPLPEPSSNQPSEDHSSLAPSQSASQIAHPRSFSPPPMSMPYTLQIPPAHSISEFALPNGTAQPRVPEEEGGSSGDEEVDMQNLEMHENERFLPKKKAKSMRHGRSASEVSSNQHVHFVPSPSDSVLYKQKGKEKKERHRSMSFFGGIASLFHHKTPNRDDEEGDRSRSPSPIGRKWRTRTDKNLAKKSRDGSSSDEEDTRYTSGASRLARTPALPSSSPVIPNGIGPSMSSQRLKKRTARRSSVQVSPSASTPTLKEKSEERGWASDGGTTTGGTIKGTKKSAKAGDLTNRGEASQQAGPSQTTRSGTVKPPTKKPKPKMGTLSSALPTEAVLSRNSSLSKHSTMSAPATSSRGAASTTIYPAITPVSRHASISASSPARKRTASLDVSKLNGRAGPSSSPTKVLSGKGYPSVRASSNSNVKDANPSMSLMSIVEDVQKNRETYMKQQDPNRMLISIKAPPPVSESLDLLDFDKELDKQESVDKEQERPAREDRTKGQTKALNTSPVIPTQSSTSPPANSKSPIHAEKKPLRSALRNSSRSPSPNVSPRSSPPQPVAGPSKLRSSTTASESQQILVPSLSKRNDDLDEVSSLSSYETGHEAFDDSETATPTTATPPPPPPPPHDEPQNTPLNSDLSHSNTDSTVNSGTQPVRRKSVRMSLPPTFSTTPPAIDDDDLDEEDDNGRPTRRRRHEPWSAPRRSSSTRTHSHRSVKERSDDTIRASSGWSSKMVDDPPVRDVWADSSDEDEEYGKAKRLLAKLSGKG